MPAALPWCCSQNAKLAPAANRPKDDANPSQLPARGPPETCTDERQQAQGHHGKGGLLRRTRAIGISGLVNLRLAEAEAFLVEIVTQCVSRQSHQTRFSLNCRVACASKRR